MTDRYRLADKLKREFRERGSEVNGMRATTTSELMRRAEMGRDPRINCAEEAFRENYAPDRRCHTPQAQPNPQTVRRQNIADGAQYGQAIPSSTARSRVRSAEEPSVSGARPSEPLRSRTQNRQNPAGTGNRREENVRFARTAGSEKKAVPPQNRSVGAVRTEEVQQVQKKYIPPLLLAYLIVATILFLSFIFSITEVYKASSQLSQLQNQLEQLEETEQDMELRLEEKNDIREIEAIATGRLGMTKEDSLQRRFVSLSDGERIELAETEDENAAGGVMLSSVFSALGRFLERFR